VPMAHPEPIDQALSAPWWRRRRMLPWVIAAVAVLVTAIAIGVFVVEDSSQPQAVARLTPQGRQPGPASIPVDDDVPVRYDLTVEDSSRTAHTGRCTYGARRSWRTSDASPWSLISTSPFSTRRWSRLTIVRELARRLGRRRHSPLGDRCPRHRIHRRGSARSDAPGADV
jgi:hypothetical protein